MRNLMPPSVSIAIIRTEMKQKMNAGKSVLALYKSGIADVVKA